VGFLGDVFEAVLIGLVTGTLYGLIGLGVVLIFKSQRVINFAQAEFATFGAFMLFVYHVLLGIPYGFAAVAAVLTTVVLSVVVERLVIKPLRKSPDVTTFVATAGIALLIIGVTFVVAGANIEIVPPAFAGPEAWFAERGLGLVSPQRLLVLGILLSCALGLGAFFTRAPLGKAILAMSAEPFAVRLAGVSTERISMLVWGIAGLLAGLAGVAIIPTTALFPGVFTSAALIPALTAVVVGGLTSLPGAFVGGLTIGIVAELFSMAAPAELPGPNIVSSFIILLAVLLFRPQGLLAKGA
jgi:branched-chain amino acid transport system permease protein